LITGTRLFVAWVGDSRCLLCRRVTVDEISTMAMTEDHRPSVEAEAERVRAAQGVVVDFGGGFFRVAHPGYEERIREIRRAQAQGLGRIGKEPMALAVSRALGDREFKAVTGKALLIPTPGVRSFQLNRSHRCIALMSDGICDVMSNGEAIDELQAHDDVRAACGALVQEAYKRGSQDNLTVIYVRFEWEGGAADLAEEAEARKAKALAAKLEAARGGGKKAGAPESAAAVSKRRRIDAAASVNAQKVAAYERAIQAEAQAEALAAKEAEKNGGRAAAEVDIAAAVPRPTPPVPVQSAAAAAAAPEAAPAPAPAVAAEAAEKPKAQSTAAAPAAEAKAEDEEEDEDTFFL